MITHKRNQLITSAFGWLAKSKIQNSFRRLSLTKDSVLPKFEPHTPIIIIANHSSWWDALLGPYLSHYVFKKESYGVFDEEQLKRYAIFRWIGAYSLMKGSASEGRKFLKYTKELLVSKPRALWIFPQGDLFHNDHVPFVFEKGFASIIASLPRVHLLKMVISYDFWIESKPEIVVDVLPLETLQAQRSSAFISKVTRHAEGQMTARMRVVRDIVKHRKQDLLIPLLTKEHGTNPVYDSFRSLKFKVRGEKFQRSHSQ